MIVVCLHVCAPTLLKVDSRSVHPGIQSSVKTGLVAECRTPSVLTTCTNATRDITPLEGPGAASTVTSLGLYAYSPPGLRVPSLGREDARRREGTPVRCNRHQYTILPLTFTEALRGRASREEEPPGRRPRGSPLYNRKHFCRGSR